MKRFWKEVHIKASDDGFTILLDERAIKTPGRADLTLPNAGMADAVAQEWRNVGEKVDPASMPITGFANAAIDRVRADKEAFVDAIAAFGESDLFCYRAESPTELVERQGAIWGQWIRWAEALWNADLAVVHGIMHRPQSPEILSAARASVAELNEFQLAAASKLTHLSGSLIAVLALAEGQVSADELWPDLILDELWQEEQWGADEFALKNRNDRAAEFAEAARFLAMCA